MMKGSCGGSKWIETSEAKEAVAKLVADIPRLQPLRKSWDWSNPALNVIDCVLSLRRNYERMVFPRVKDFAKERPDIRTLELLRDTILKETPFEFGVRNLRYHDEKRMKFLLSVTERLIQQASDHADLAAWASSTKLGDEVCFGVKGFGPAGFQYLRILFGAQTFKPDMHILAHVKAVTGLDVVPNDAVELLSEAATQADASARDLDHTIWYERAGATFTSPIGQAG